MNAVEPPLRVELLLGARVRDSDGCVAGRIEEVRAERVGGEWVIVEYHLGAAALLERLTLAVKRLPLLSALPFGTRMVRCARWDQMAFDDAYRPRLSVPREQLTLIQPR